MWSFKSAEGKKYLRYVQKAHLEQTQTTRNLSNYKVVYITSISYMSCIELWFYIILYHIYIYTNSVALAMHFYLWHPVQGTAAPLQPLLLRWCPGPNIQPPCCQLIHHLGLSGPVSNTGCHWCIPTPVRLACGRIGHQDVRVKAHVLWRDMSNEGAKNHQKVVSFNMNTVGSRFQDSDLGIG